MTTEQEAAITQCIEAFNIPRDCRNFVLRIYTTDAYTYPYGSGKRVAADLTVDHAPVSVSDV